VECHWWPAGPQRTLIFPATATIGIAWTPLAREETTNEPNRPRTSSTVQRLPLRVRSVPRSCRRLGQQRGSYPAAQSARRGRASPGRGGPEGRCAKADGEARAALDAGGAGVD